MRKRSEFICKPYLLNRIEEYCFEPCWGNPGGLHIIDGEAFEDGAALCQTKVQQKKSEKMDLRIPVVYEDELWDEEGIRRFEKSVGSRK